VISLKDLVDDSVSMLERIIGEDIRIICEFEDDAWAIEADPAQIEQVLLNLATNARDAMPDGGVLTLRVRNAELHDQPVTSCPEPQTGQYTLLSVSDTGLGMSAEVCARIFEPFFTTKEVGKGTGLGLSVCYGIITDHGGRLNVRSNISKGTTFTIYLPRK
jgi:signal transduction histidine kinase